MEFIPIYLYNYVGGKEQKTARNDVIGVDFKNGSRTIEFYIHDGYPSLPLKNWGELWSTGWDIPTRWAIDNEGQTWMDNAHGHALNKCTKEILIGEAETYLDKVHLCKMLGIKPPQPEWYKTALKEGWIPPEGLIIDE